MKVSLTELIRTGRVPVGTVLYHPNRTRPDTAVTATITSGGIKLGSRVFDNPSAAAKSVAKYEVNGWYFWKLRDSGEPLRSLRP